jgi:N-acetylmuramoyl-L-alanine amidase
MKIKAILISLLLSSASFGYNWTDVIRVPDQYISDVNNSSLTEFECLALNVYHESRGEGVFGRKLVAQVTMNRVRHHGFPDNICDVVRQEHQFSWTNDGKFDHPVNREAYEISYLIAIAFIQFDFNIQMKYSSLILNYHNLDVEPGWHELTPVMIQGGHKFYVRKRDINE